MRIWGEVCPGYNLVGIDCDNTNNNIIAQSGAIHCITHTVGVADPLLISHQPLQDTYDTNNPYLVSAYLNHRSGVERSTLYWRHSGETNFNTIEMTSNLINWEGYIPAQPTGSIIEYYIEGESVSGKIQVRPMPAPEGFWTFEVLGEPLEVSNIRMNLMQRIYPNPASSITCIELNAQKNQPAKISLIDVAGRTVSIINEGMIPQGSSNYFLHANQFESGAYRVLIQSGSMHQTMPLMIK